MHFLGIRRPDGGLPAEVGGRRGRSSGNPTAFGFSEAPRDLFSVGRLLQSSVCPFIHSFVRSSACPPADRCSALTRCLFDCVNICVRIGRLCAFLLVGFVG